MFRHSAPERHRTAVDAGRTDHRAGNCRLRVGDLSLRLSAFRRVIALSFASRPGRLRSNSPDGSPFRFDRGRPPRLCCRSPGRGGCLPGSMDGSLAVSRLDHIGPGCDTGRRHSRSGDSYLDDVIRGVAHLPVVFASLVIHYWNCDHGRPGAAPTEFVSFPRHLDLAALDPCYWDGFSNRARRACSHGWFCSPTAARFEHPAMGHSSFSHCNIDHAPAFVRSGSEPAKRDLLWRPDIRRDRNRAPNFGVGARTGRPGLRYRLHPLPAGSKCLPNVRPQGARSRARPAQSALKTAGTGTRSPAACVTLLPVLPGPRPTLLTCPYRPSDTPSRGSRGLRSRPPRQLTW